MKLRRLVLGAFAVAGLVGLNGCLVCQAVKTTGDLALTSVIVAGKTATAVVKTTGKVAGSAITSSGSLTASGIESLAALAQAGMVTFVDVVTGVIVRVPWEQGMTLHAAGAAAEVKVAERAVDLVRGGRLVYTAAKHMQANPPLQPGDVVRLAGRTRR